MTSLRHYHLGCGESLHSTFDYLHGRDKRRVSEQTEHGHKNKTSRKQGKKH